MSNTLAPRYYTDYTTSVASWIWIVIAVIVVAKLLIITIICVRCARRRRMRAFTPGQNVHMNPAYQQQQQQVQTQQNGHYNQQPPYVYTGPLPANSSAYVAGEKGAQTTGVVTEHGLEAGAQQQQQQQQQHPMYPPRPVHIYGYSG